MWSCRLDHAVEFGVGVKNYRLQEKIRNYYINYAVLENVLQYEKSGKFYTERAK